MRVTFEGTIHEVLDQMEEFAKSIVDGWSKPVAQPKPKKAKVEIEQPAPTPCQAHAVEQEKEEAEVKLEVPEDLLGAVMALVNGDKEKKAKLVKLLAFYEAKTIGALKPAYREKFWLDVTNALAKEES